MTSTTRWKLSGFGDEIDADPKIQTSVLAALGASAIEVRSAWDTNIVDMTPQQLTELDSILKGEGFEVSAIGSPIGKVDVQLDIELELDRLRSAINASHVLGSDYIRIFSFYPGDSSPDQVKDKVFSHMEKIVQLAEQESVTLLHENEKDIYGDTPERILGMCDHLNHPNFKLAWDSANFVQVGVSDLKAAWELLADQVVYLQVKDALSSDSSVVPPGEGDGEIEYVVSKLSKAGYEGFASMEPHLSQAFSTGGFSGPQAFGLATRSFRKIAERFDVELI